MLCECVVGNMRTSVWSDSSMFMIHLSLEEIGTSFYRPDALSGTQPT